MGRVKEFDRDLAVRRAAEVFWDKGFEATSTDDLLRAMGIGRQSMYNAFGDKRRLYLEALNQYQADSGSELFARLRVARSPLSALSSVMLAIAKQTADERSRGCLSVNAAAEFGQSDDEMATLLNSGVSLCVAAFERILVEAKDKGEVRADVEPLAGARFLHATLTGMRLNARAGAPPETLHDIATVAIDGLRPR